MYYLISFGTIIFSQLFPKHDRFKGKVSAFDPTTGLYAIDYDDGDHEYLSEYKVANKLQRAKVDGYQPHIANVIGN